MNTQNSPEILQNTRQENQESSNDLRTKVQETARNVKDAAQEWQRKATEAARNATRLTDNYVHENAWTSLALAAVVGCIIGFLMARGRD